jgi:hypothetical protein
MNQIAPRRPPPGLGPRLIEKPQEALDHSDLLALLQRHEAGLEKHPVVVPVAALDGEGGRRVHQAMSAGLKGPGDALRVIVGVENETLETMPLIGPGVFDANWSRMTVLLKSLADRLGCNIEVTPYVVAVPLEEPDDEEADSWDETWGDEYDEQEDQAPEVPCGHVVLAYCLLKSAHGARGAFPSSSMW